MRPTNLKFVSPKEQTPGFNYPQITRLGATAQFQKLKEHPNFPRGGRWQYLQEITKRTSYDNGPGRHDLKLSTNGGQSFKISKDSIIENNKSNKQWEFAYVGNTLVKVEKTQTRCSTSTMNTTNTVPDSPETKSPKSRATSRDLRNFTIEQKFKTVRSISVGKAREWDSRKDSFVRKSPLFIKQSIKSPQESGVKKEFKLPDNVQEGQIKKKKRSKSRKLRNQERELERQSEKEIENMYINMSCGVENNLETDVSKEV